jgi:hypothetical protein
LTDAFRAGKTVRYREPGKVSMAGRMYTGDDLDGDELDGDDIDGDVLGDVLGDDLDGDSEVIIGAIAVNPRTGRRRIIKPNRAARGRGVARPRNAMALPPKPGWRKNQVAPGVQAPSEGMVPLPLVGIPGTTFTNLVTQITFRGQVQEPFRPERLLCSVTRTGASAAAPRVMGQLFVGTKLQQAQIAAFDIELVGTANAFGVRLTCQQVEPGVFVDLQCFLSAALVAGDTILVSPMFLGRVIQ